jgi:hypothetical protein
MKGKSEDNVLSHRSEMAMITYPIYIMVVITVMILILILISYGVSYLSHDMNIQQVERTIESIVYQAETLTVYADKGTVQTMAISLPSDLNCLCFGGRPEHSDDINGTVQWNTNLTNMVYYKMNNGEEKAMYSKISFKGKTTQMGAILPPGEYVIQLSIEQQDDETYVKIILKP